MPTALAKAQNGNLGALGRLGVATKDASGHTMTLDQITKNLAATYQGQASAAANTAAGKYARLKLMLSETGESIGYKLLPVITALATLILNRVVPAVSSFGSHMSTKLGPSLRQVGDYIRTKIIPSLSQMATWARAHLVPALQQLTGFIVGRFIPAMVQWDHWLLGKIVPAIARAVVPVIRGLKAVFDSVTASLQRNRPQLEQVRATLQRVVEFIVGRVLPILARLTGFMLKNLGPIIGITIDGFARWVSMVSTVVGQIRSLMGWLGKIHVPSALREAAGLAGKAVGHVPGFAHGGITPGGVVRVGELGPENVVLPRGSRVIPASRSRIDYSGGLVPLAPRSSAGMSASDRRALAADIAEAVAPLFTNFVIQGDDLVLAVKRNQRKRGRPVID